jgi:CheY-like chemotaxis protein
VLLVVDDYPENLISMRALLARQDWQVLTASSGMEALSALLEHEVDLVLLDVQMPEMDGFEVARLMRGSQRTRLTPIIFLTANEQSDAVLKAMPVARWTTCSNPSTPNPQAQGAGPAGPAAQPAHAAAPDPRTGVGTAFNASILENAAEGILVVDEAGTIGFANPAISRLLNAPVDTLQGAHVLDLIQLPCASLWRESDFYQAYLGGRSSACMTPNCAPSPANWCRWRCPARRCPSSRPWW